MSSVQHKLVALVLATELSHKRGVSSSHTESAPQCWAFLLIPITGPSSHRHNMNSIDVDKSCSRIALPNVLGHPDQGVHCHIHSLASASATTMAIEDLLLDIVCENLSTMFAKVVRDPGLDARIWWFLAMPRRREAVMDANNCLPCKINNDLAVLDAWNCVVELGRKCAAKTK